MPKSLNEPLSEAVARASVAAVDAAIASGATWPPVRGLSRSALAEAARALGVASPTLRNRLAVAQVRYGLAPAAGPLPGAVPNHDRMRARREAARKGEMGFAPVLPGYEISETVETTDRAGAVVRRSVRQRQARGEAFAVPEGHLVKGVSALLDGEGRVIAQWTKTTAEGRRLEVVLKAIRAHHRRYIKPCAPEPAPPAADEDLLTLYPVADHHLGLYAWARETGADYDLDIASRLLRDTATRLMQMSPASGQAVLLGLGDFFHADSSKNATPASGHVLDVDSRYAKVIETGCNLWADLVHLALRRHGVVTVRMLPGNHDPHAVFSVVQFLRAYFRDDPRVTIDADPSLFWFYRFGRVFLAATHGHAAKIERMPGIMAASRPREWGETDFRYAFGAHLHHRRQGGANVDGVTWETVPTLTARDAYAAGQGWTAMREMIAHTYHRNKGRCSTVMENVV